MKLAIHFVSERDDGGKRRNLAYDPELRAFRSGNWDIPLAEARDMIGGWLYLHPTKGEPSDFGGRILACEPIIDPSVARQDRVVFIVEVVPAARGQRWRGENHPRAWTGRPVPANLPHE